MAAKRTDAARGVLWISFIVLMTLMWFGPAAWLRGDTSQAESAERAASDAETAAQTPPAFDPVTAREVISSFEALCLAQWSDEAAFWTAFLPEPPEGLLMTSLGYSEPERAAGGVHLRNVSIALTVPVDPDTDPAVAVEAAAPGGLDGTWEWIAALNARPDMELLSTELSTTGAASISFGVWIRDAPEGTDSETPGEDPSDGTVC